MTGELAAFLAARLDEDEREAGEFHREDCESLPSPGYTGPFPCNCGYPGRVLREVAAKRAILRRCSARMNEMDEYPNGLVSPRALLARQTLMCLASVYSGHPDYRPEWNG
jgi:hypothetical protein